jgi:hypothetical protein
MLKKCVVERKANLQLGEKEGHAILGAISWDCKVQANLLDQLA